MNRIKELAQSKQDELLNIIENSSTIQAQSPLFHFATPGGWCNDPNGFSQFKDKVHLFYQYHPYSTKWGPMHWGHVTTRDLLTWELQPVALAPDTEADCKGCFSGTAMDDNGTHLIAYTGVTNNGNVDIQNQCLAAGDGVTYTKLSDQPAITAKDIPFEYNPEHFRDPKIWKKDGTYYMACVIKQKNDTGALILFQSQDARKWTYKGMPDFSKDGLSRMWECPDLLTLNDKDVLILSPQEMKEDYNLGFHNGNNSVYITGKMDYENCKFTRDVRPENGYTAAQIDYGIDFYAPETTKLKDGRTIMIAWMHSWESYITPEDYMWSGMMTIPRELTLKNNQLYQLPVRELENWKCNEEKGVISATETAGTDPSEIEATLTKGTDPSETAGSSSVKTISFRPRQFLLDLNVKAASNGTVKVLLGNAEKEHVVLEINTNENYISFDRSSSRTPGTVPFRKAKLQGIKEDRNFLILCDTCSMEVFVDQGKMAFTNTFFFTDAESECKVINETSGSIEYAFWDIKKQQA